MPAERDGRMAACQRCGAALSLAQGDRARCVYCLLSQPLPAGVASPLQATAALSAQLDRAERTLGRIHAGRKSIWIILGVNVPGLLMAIGTFIWATSVQEGSFAKVMYAFIGLGGMAPFLAVPLLWMRVQAKARARELARLPLSVPQVEGDHLTSSCPRCGAAHAPTGALTAVCSHCRTEALLPLPLVEARLGRQHRRVIEARLQTSAETHAGMAAVQMWQKEVVPWIMAFCILFGIIVVTFVVIAEAGP